MHTCAFTIYVPVAVWSAQVCVLLLGVLDFSFLVSIIILCNSLFFTC